MLSIRDDELSRVHFNNGGMDALRITHLPSGISVCRDRRADGSEGQLGQEMLAELEEKLEAALRTEDLSEFVPVSRLWRFIFALITIVTCMLCGVLGAIAAMCSEFQSPLSAANSAGAIGWGLMVGGDSAFISVLSLLVLPPQRMIISWVMLFGGAMAFLVTFVCVWFHVPSSLG
jgi:hypothetical protein